jgi:iron complex transport system ATP-binding protein
MVESGPLAGQTEAAPFVAAENLSFSYGSQLLLSGLQIRVACGEMIGLLGPNGSGKTTLVKLLAGVLHPQQGRILLEGRDLAAWERRAVARRVAVVPQEMQVPFAFTVEQMVALGRTPFVRLLGNPGRRDREIVDAAMQVAEVATLSRRVFNELSGGERQRVLVAMALAQQPRLLLLDEPTAHLDIKYQVEVLELLRRLNCETGVTVIAAMHDLNLAARYFPRLLLFQRGIVADGGPAEVLEPRLLHRVYGIAVQVGVMHGAEHLSVLPAGEAAGVQEGAIGVPAIHLMAGGGSGALVMRALADARLAFSAGVLHIGDSDHTLAQRLAAAVISEQPCAPISADARVRLRTRLQEASLLILCPMPIGQGNLAQLEEALAFCLRGGPVILLLPGSVEMPRAEEVQPQALLQLLQARERDYTQGEGAGLLLRLLEAGAVSMSSLGAVVAHARRQDESPGSLGSSVQSDARDLRSGR